MKKYTGLVIILALICLIVGKSYRVASAETTSPERSPTGSLGTNIGAVVDWTTEYPFNDYFKMSRRWITQCVDWADAGCNNAWDTGEFNLLDVDADGWVRSLPASADAPIYSYVSTLIFTAEPHHAEGNYIVLYEGEGEILYGFGATKDFGLSAPGRDVVDLVAGGSFYISIISTDPNATGDYIRNIRVVKPAHEADYQTNLFNPDFLAKISDLRTLRYMDFMETNSSTQADWANRPTMSQSTYGNDEGVPADLMVTLSNETDQTPWFTMPHLATDDYFTQFATLVRDDLDSDMAVYVEYSNEVWNGIFAQSTYAEQQGNALFNSGDDFQDTINWYGKRSAEMCDIWKTVFVGQTDRVICVIGSQTNSWVSEQALNCPLWAGGPCVDHGIDTLAIAPYFGGYIGYPHFESTLVNWTLQADGGLNSLFTELETGGMLGGSAPANGALQESYAAMSANKTVADNFNVELIAYEGGQHLTGVNGVENNTAITDLFIAANRDPRMGTLYTQYLNQWKTEGGCLFAVYSLVNQPSKWGSWGALEYIHQPASPKYDAIHTFTTTVACWWSGCSAVPTQVTLNNVDTMAENTGGNNMPIVFAMSILSLSLFARTLKKRPF